MRLVGDIIFHPLLDVPRLALPVEDPAQRGWWMRYGSVPHERRECKDQCNDRTGNVQDQSEHCRDSVGVAS
jgi:hypothetical protein